MQHHQAQNAFQFSYLSKGKPPSIYYCNVCTFLKYTLITVTVLMEKITTVHINTIVYQYRINSEIYLSLLCFFNICCRKVREAPVEIEENEQEIKVKEPHKSRKESNKEEARAEKYNKKDKIKQAGEQPYVTKEKRRPKEQESRAYKKTTSDERKQLKRQIVAEVVETEIVENNEEESEGEESLKCPPQACVEENKLEAVTVPSKSCIIENTTEEDIQEEEPNVLEDEETSDVENVPAKKCYNK